MSKATHLLRKASELVREKRYPEAVEVYLQATETDPTDCRAWFGLGVCLYKIGNLDVARIALERAEKMGYAKAAEALSRLKTAEKRRSAEGSGAKPSTAPEQKVSSPGKRPAPTPQRPTQKVELDRFVRIMLIENLQSDRRAITSALEAALRDVEVVAADYGVSTSDTMSGTVHYDVAILDWDTDPDAAAGLIQILKIKRPSLLVICLTEKWNAGTATQILHAGADCHLVKLEGYHQALPLLLGRAFQRDRAVQLLQRGKEGGRQTAEWPDEFDAVDDMLLYVAPDYAIVQANQAAMKGFRKREEQFVGRSYPLVLYGTEEPPESCPFSQTLATGEPTCAEVKNGELNVVYTANVWADLDQSGRVVGAIARLEEKQAASVPEDLLQREQMYRNLAERCSVGLALVDPSGATSYVNRALCTMLDQTAEELVGKPVESIAPPEEHQSLRECLEAALDIGESAGRLSLCGSAGERLPVEARIARFSEGGQTWLALGAVEVGELEEAEEALWAETRRWAGILEDGINRLECGVVVLDSTGTVTWANSLAEDVLGVGDDGLAEKGYLQVVKSLADSGRLLEGDAFLEVLQRVHAAGEAVQEHAVELDGEGGALEYWSSPSGGESPAVARVEHFYFLPEVQLAAPPEGDSLADIAAAVPEMMFTTDAEGRITWCSPGARETAGYTAHRLCGESLAQLAPPQQRAELERLVRDALNGGSPIQRKQVRMARADGQSFWAELTLLRSSNGQSGLHGAVRDITDHRITDAIRAILSGEENV